MSDLAEKFSCGGCGKSYTWKPELAGKRVKCKCGTVIAVPAAELAPIPAEPEDLYDFAPSNEPPKPVHKPAPPAAPVATGKAAKTKKTLVPSSGGAAAIASPVLGYRQGPNPREKDHFSADTLLDMKRDAYVPIALLVVGLALSVVYYAIHYHLGTAGIAMTSLGVGAMTAFKALLLVGFALAIASPLGVGFGGLWTAVLKLAAIAVFSDGVTTWVDAGLSKAGAAGLETIISFPISLAVYWGLLIYLFSMDAGDSWLVVMLLAVFDTIVRWVILLLLLNAVLSLGGVVSASPASKTAAGPGGAVAQRVQDLEDEGFLKEAHPYYTTEGHTGQMQGECEAWYAAGAKHVWYEVSRDINGKMTIDTIYVELPDDKTKRATCYKILDDFYLKRAKGYVPSPHVDKGEPYLEIGVPHSF